MDVLLQIGLAIVCFGSVPWLLRQWRARRGWVRVRARVSEVSKDGRLVCAFEDRDGPREVRLARWGEGEAGPGDLVVLHHPPGRPEAAVPGSGFGYLAATGLAILLGVASVVLLFA